MLCVSGRQLTVDGQNYDVGETAPRLQLVFEFDEFEPTDVVNS